MKVFYPYHRATNQFEFPTSNDPTISINIPFLFSLHFQSVPPKSSIVITVRRATSRVVGRCGIISISIYSKPSGKLHPLSTIPSETKCFAAQSA